MTWENFTYLGLMLGSLSYPLANSWEKRIRYASKWKFLAPAIALTGVFFIAWDVFFTRIGVWSFAPEYVTGIWLVDLPIEEWLFFIIIPFCCVFIYECVDYFLGEKVWQSWAPYVFYALALGLGALAIYHHDKWYTSVKLGSMALMIVIHIAWFGHRYLGRFLVAYLFTLIPFLLVNGTLTYLPVVSYNDAENLGIRISDLTGIPFFNIPIEDTMYSMLLLMMNVSLYEYGKSRAQAKTSAPVVELSH